MSPATAGLTRGGWTGQPYYAGGRQGGQSCPPGWHPLRRDEFGRSLDGAAQMPPGYYVLYVTDDGRLLYLHSSWVPDPQCA
jgi:hypothetical protein